VSRNRRGGEKGITATLSQTGLSEMGMGHSGQAIQGPFRSPCLHLGVRSPLTGQQSTSLLGCGGRGEWGAVYTGQCLAPPSSPVREPVSSLAIHLKKCRFNLQLTD
jgi:hypothetical protein